MITKNKVSKLLLLAILVLSITTACTKDEMEEEIPLTTREKFVNTFWLMTAFDVDLNNDGNFTKDNFSIKEDCEKDDIFQFRDDNKYVLDNGALKCSSSAPQTVIVREWAFNIDETIVSFIEDGDILFSVEIIELTEDRLIYYYRNPSAPQVSRYIFERKS